MTDKRSIWCLFSVECLHDQPANNLVAWWDQKPSFDTLAKALGVPGFPANSDAATLFIVKVWEGEGERQMAPGQTMYRLVQVAEGKIL